MPYVFMDELPEGMEEATVYSEEDYNDVTARLEQAQSENTELAAERDNLARELDAAKTKELDEGRLEVEITMFADRCCIDEELTRLVSHIRQYRQTLEKQEPIGRQLDFLTQELNREANTIASKSNDLTITQLALAMKNVIEKIREQIQNIE